MTRTLAVVVGLAVGVCTMILNSSACGDCPCPEQTEQIPLARVEYQVIDAYTRGEMVDAVVSVSDQDVVVTYALPDGSRWRVTYTVEESG